MMQPIDNPQRSLLEVIEEVPRITLPPAQKAQLATLLEALLAEIAAVLATGEARDDKDHG